MKKYIIFRGKLNDHVIEGYDLKINERLRNYAQNNVSGRLVINEDEIVQYFEGEDYIIDTIFIKALLERELSYVELISEGLLGKSLFEQLKLDQITNTSDKIVPGFIESHAETTYVKELLKSIYNNKGYLDYNNFWSGN